MVSVPCGVRRARSRRLVLCFGRRGAAVVCAEEVVAVAGVLSAAAESGGLCVSFKFCLGLLSPSSSSLPVRRTDNRVEWRRRGCGKVCCGVLSSATTYLLDILVVNCGIMIWVFICRASHASFRARSITQYGVWLPGSRFTAGMRITHTHTHARVLWAGNAEEDTCLTGGHFFGRSGDE